MSNALAQSGVAVLGGDQRQLLVAETMLNGLPELKPMGWLPVSDRPRLYPVSSIKEAVSDARLLSSDQVGPMVREWCKQANRWRLTSRKSFGMRLENRL